MLGFIVAPFEAGLDREPANEARRVDGADVEGFLAPDDEHRAPSVTGKATGSRAIAAAVIGGADCCFSRPDH